MTRRTMAWAAVSLLTLSLAANPARCAADGQGRYRIAMIVYRGCEEACKGFVDYLKARQIPADVEVLDAATDLALLRAHVARVKREKPDLAVTWGTTVSLEALGTYDHVDPARHLVEMPVLFMIVSNPLKVRLVPSLDSSGRNIAGTRYLVPEETQLKAARSYLPFERLAVIYNPKEKNAVQTVANLRALSGSLGFALQAYPVHLAGGKPDPASLPELVAEAAAAGAQLLYQPPDSFLLLHRAALTQAAIDHGLPVFAASEAPVRSAKALMGVVNRYYTVGQLTATLAEKILVHGVRPHDLPIEAPKNFSFLVNLDAARTLQRYPPMKVLRIAEIIE